jgi:hypothetical protein
MQSLYPRYFKMPFLDWCFFCSCLGKRVLKNLLVINILGMTLLLMFLSQSSYAKKYKVMLGDTPVLVQHIAGQGKTFVHLHQNETTALDAAKAVIHKNGGGLITLIHKGTRNIVFHMHHKRYEFDPNRIFTDKGIKMTLTQLSQYSPEAHRAVKRLAHQIRTLIPEGKVIAVHNNASYSLRDYLPGHSLASDAEAIHLSAENYYRNFYLVTRLHEYQRLKNQGFNGVLQKPQANDDGSLSIVFAEKNYINVEAGYGQLSEQIRMLNKA